jgi:hypothetical protein
VIASPSRAAFASIGVTENATLARATSVSMETANTLLNLDVIYITSSLLISIYYTSPYRLIIQIDKKLRKMKNIFLDKRKRMINKRKVDFLSLKTNINIDYCLYKMYT